MLVKRPLTTKISDHKNSPRPLIEWIIFHTNTTNIPQLNSREITIPNIRYTDNSYSGLHLYNNMQINVQSSCCAGFIFRKKMDKFMINPCPSFNVSLARQPLRLGHGCVTTFQISMWMWLFIHVSQAMVNFYRVSNVLTKVTRCPWLYPQRGIPVSLCEVSHDDCFLWHKT